MSMVKHKRDNTAALTVKRDAELQALASKADASVFEVPFETQADLCWYELPYRQQEFAQRYRALMLTRTIHHPSHLIGRSEASNALNGYPVEPPLLLGDPQRAAQVHLSGEGHTARPKLTDARPLASAARVNLVPATEQEAA